jgi:hypothetical protein
MQKKAVGMTVMSGAVAALAVMGGASAARADEPIKVMVPFAFIVGDSRLPPGDYIVHDRSIEERVLEKIALHGAAEAGSPR